MKFHEFFTELITDDQNNAINYTVKGQYRSCILFRSKLIIDLLNLVNQLKFF